MSVQNGAMLTPTSSMVFIPQGDLLLLLLGLRKELPRESCQLFRLARVDMRGDVKIEEAVFQTSGVQRCGRR